MEEHVVQITTGGKLRNEIARYDLRLTWSVKGLIIFTKDDDQADGVAGVINRTRHTLYSIYEDPLNPEVSNASGEKWSADTGLTTQRLDKLLVAIGAKNHRFPTPTADDIDDLIWLLHKHVNDSSPPYFNGARDIPVRYGMNGRALDVTDQWVMWLKSHSWNRPSGEPKHWNFGACITYVQLMKTMLAMAGINSRRAWLYPKTTHLPKSNTYPNGRDIELADSELVSLDDETKTAQPQSGTIHLDGIEYNVQVKLIDKPGANGDIHAENFEACLYYGGKVVPAAIPTHRYPTEVLDLEIGFRNPTEMLRWWHDLKHGDFQRFMAWVSHSPQGFFDNDGNIYDSPYEIPVELRLPVP
jgi:hypothetical protein